MFRIRDNLPATRDNSHATRDTWIYPIYVYVNDETTSLFHVKFLVSQLWTTVPISLSAV